MTISELHALSLELREWSAVLATGRPAVLMAQAAAVLSSVTIEPDESTTDRPAKDAKS